MLEFTGERLTTEVLNGNTIRHLHRYAIAFDSVKNKHVLDLACGEGYGSNLLALHAKSVIGMDIDPVSISHAQTKYKKNNLSFQTASADNIPLPDNSVDVVVSFETIEHHDKHVEMLSEFKRILKPDGILIISSPDKRVNTEILGTINEFHVKELYAEEFKSLLSTYFSNTQFLLQKEVAGSLIIPEDKVTELHEFQGNFSTIRSIDTPLFTFNIAIASNSALPEAIYTSYFESFEFLYHEIGVNKRHISTLAQQIDEYERKLKMINDSGSYKLAKNISKIIHSFKNWFK